MNGYGLFVVTLRIGWASGDKYTEDVTIRAVDFQHAATRAEQQIRGTFGMPGVRRYQCTAAAIAVKVEGN